MLDRQNLETILMRRFPAATSQHVAAAKKPWLLVTWIPGAFRPKGDFERCLTGSTGGRTAPIVRERGGAA